MSNARRDIRVIEEVDQELAGRKAFKRDRPEAEIPPDASMAGVEDAPAEAPQFATPFSTDGLRGIDSESYLTGSSLGVALRQARLKRKLGLDDVAEVLHIRKEYLQAIEQGNYQVLPGPTYAAGFVRTYAGHLGLDTAEAIQRYKAEARDQDPQTELTFPKPSEDNRRPGVAVLLGAVIVAGVLFGAWYMFSGEDAPEAQTAAKTPTATEAQPASSETAPAAKPAAPAQPPATPAETPAAPQGSSEPATPTAGEPATPTPTVDPAPAEQAPPAAETPAPAESGETPAAAAEETPPEQAAAVDGARPRVQVTVVSDSWVQVRNAEGAVIFTKLLRPGDIYEAPADERGLTLLTGDAGALRIRVDGRDLPPVGSSGEVRRDISLDPDSLLAGAGASQ